MGKQSGESLPEWARDTEWGEIRISLKPDGEATKIERMNDGKICVKKSHTMSTETKEGAGRAEHEYSLAFPESALRIDSTLKEAMIELRRRMNAGSGDSAFVDGRPLIQKRITTTYLTSPYTRTWRNTWGSEVAFKGRPGPELYAVVELPEKAREIIAERRRQSRGE